MPSITSLITPLVLLVSVIFVLPACSSFQSNNHTREISSVEIAKQSKLETIALIYTQLDGEQIPFCTGVWVDKTTILTANHCVEGYAEMKRKMDIMKTLVDAGVPKRLAARVAESEVDDMNEENEMGRYFADIIRNHPKLDLYGLEIPFSKYDGQIDEKHFKTQIGWNYKYSKEKDLALLKVKMDESSFTNNHEIIRLAKTEPEVGEIVYQIGHAGNPYSFKMGTISAYRKASSEQVKKEFGIKGPLMQIDCLAYMGDSGGGIFNTNGELVGILSFINEDARIAYAIPMENIVRFYTDK